MLCPAACFCPIEGTEVITNCSNKGLATVPTMIDTNTTILDLSGNNLETLGTSLDDITSLVSLDVRRNPLLNNLPNIYHLNNLNAIYTDYGASCCILEMTIKALKGINGQQWAKEICKATDPYSKGECREHLLDVGTIGLYGLVIIISIILNTWVAFVIYGIRERRADPATFILGQFPFSNLLMTIYATTMFIHSIMYYGNYHHHIDHWLNNSLCTFIGYLFITSNLMSTFVYFLIILDMFLKIAFPLYEHRHLTGKNLYIAVGMSWVLALGIASMPLMGLAEYNAISMCIPIYAGRQLGIKDNDYVAFHVAVICTAFVLIVLLLVLMLRSVKRSQTSQTISSENQKLSRNVTYLITGYIILWCTIITCMIMSVIGGGTGYTGRVAFSRVCVFDTFTNVFLYIATKKQFKVDSKKLCNQLSQICGYRSRKVAPGHNMTIITITASTPQHHNPTAGTNKNANS
ncbi:unnamed protein product [Owenia fusiformis]|uniref:G-protein coupled receptors family 1 profile domain-containing protein n=1 Tax=Owenia fusiformis TaxID=6347 RepID=A0A8S4MY08_OWEFU|nr:unnamed protein product [Owenia fusiformis]